MSTLTIVDLDATLLNSLRQRAHRHGILAEEESKAILVQELKVADPWETVDLKRK